VVYPDLVGGPKKVVYMPKVDQFMVLQLKGFYNLLTKDVKVGGSGQNSVIAKADDNRVMIMTNKHISRPIVSEVSLQRVGRDERQQTRTTSEHQDHAGPG
jgi:hypothetical protein